MIRGVGVSAILGDVFWIGTSRLEVTKISNRRVWIRVMVDDGTHVRVPKRKKEDVADVRKVTPHILEKK